MGRAVSDQSAACRTGMALQRTRMAAERTLMAVIRTSLSLIGFGFTIFQFFGHLRETGLLASGSPAPRNFGLTLVLLGVGMQAIGLVHYVRFMAGLRAERQEMIATGLIPDGRAGPVSLTMVVGLLLFLTGLAAIASMAFNVGPFG